MMPTRRPLLLLCLLGAVPMLHAEEVHDLLRGMQAALRTLSYEADLVYLHGDRLEAMRLTHVVSEGSEREQLLALNGAPREVLRDDNSVFCVEPEKRAVSVGRRHGGQELRPFRDLQPDQVAPFYRFEINGGERIAGRDARQVMIRPKDGYRYGQRLWLDQETGLPLKADRLDTEGRPISQMMFTRLRVDPTLQLPPMEEERGRRDGFSWTFDESIETGEQAAGGKAAEATEAQVSWSFPKPPPGFKLTAHARRPSAKGQPPVEHFVFGDGIATLSVYMEPIGSGPAMIGGSRLGAVNVFGAKVDGFIVTVVGEVPERTVREMAATVRYSPAGN